MDSRQQIYSFIDSQITDPTNQQNTAAVMRAVLKYIVQNAANLADDELGVNPNPDPTGFEWDTKPSLSIEGETVSVSVGLAGLNGEPVFFDAASFPVALPSEGNTRIDAVFARSNGTYGYTFGTEGDHGVTPKIPDGTLLVGYTIWTATGGDITEPPIGLTLEQVQELLLNYYTIEEVASMLEGMLTTEDVSTNVNDAAQDAKLITQAQAKALLAMQEDVTSLALSNSPNISIGLVTVDAKNWRVDWGDGSTVEQWQSAAVQRAHSYSPNFTGSARFFGSLKEFRSSAGRWSFNIEEIPSSVTLFDCGGTNILSGDYSRLPSQITWLRIQGNNTTGGSSIGLPRGLTYLTIEGANTMTGPISGLPLGLTILNISGSNSLSGPASALPRGLTFLTLAGNSALSGPLSDFPRGLTFMSVSGNNSLSGNFSDAPSGLTTLTIRGTVATVGGSASTLPRGLTVLIIEGANTLSGPVSGLPLGLNNLTVRGNNTLSGDIALGPTPAIFNIQGGNTISAYSENRSWPAMQNFSLGGNATLPSADVDRLLQDLAAANWTGSNRQIDLRGGNGARTSASNAAVATLQSKGVTVLTN